MSYWRQRGKRLQRRQQSYAGQFQPTAKQLDTYAERCAELLAEPLTEASFDYQEDRTDAALVREREGQEVIRVKIDDL